MGRNTQDLWTDNFEVEKKIIREIVKNRSPSLIPDLQNQNILGHRQGICIFNKLLDSAYAISLELMLKLAFKSHLTR